MSRIENEKAVVAKMIRLYYRRKLGLREPSTEEMELLSYAERRLTHCKFGDQKPACKRCPIHCYRSDMRAKIREVMRWAGPRMIIYDPVAAIKHLLNK
ncbi:MAG: nitrous oxide-stimulated promoter family protein [Alistipes sp.]|nr:nitrous oxide-stimulated promoter family protein [Alistipes sp.]